MNCFNSFYFILISFYTELNFGSHLNVIKIKNTELSSVCDYSLFDNSNLFHICTCEKIVLVFLHNTKRSKHRGNISTWLSFIFKNVRNEGFAKTNNITYYYFYHLLKITFPMHALNGLCNEDSYENDWIQLIVYYETSMNQQVKHLSCSVMACLSLNPRSLTFRSISLLLTGHRGITKNCVVLKLTLVPCERLW